MKQISKDRIREAKKNVVPITKAVAKMVLNKNNDIAKSRQEVCNSCDESEPDLALGGRMCKLCLCNTKPLSYSDKTCELHKWEI